MALWSEERGRQAFAFADSSSAGPLAGESVGVEEEDRSPKAQEAQETSVSTVASGTEMCLAGGGGKRGEKRKKTSAL
ncbi:hypothetical protein L249_4752 [Ophiocordyceps polyrhachis-furcata BCC 54312]|uniref:Uncharacterized protein n=1 Tax=Ophiocordyceps polyrhachis-furcata BCC 54312 TaxID=1330021 RepID=A0A367L2C2_9HYPO|nr:hypothetical protein L249_4752 [Ophiocordyceps polyrhachis-furcata BCC 54312]